MKYMNPHIPEVQHAQNRVNIEEKENYSWHITTNLLKTKTKKKTGESSREKRLQLRLQ